MIKKEKETLEEKLLNPREIDEKIAELQRQKLLMKSSEFKPKSIVRITDFSKINEEDVFDYKTYYEVSDIRNNSVYYLNGVQVAALFGMNEEYKKQFGKKNTNAQAQLDDKIISFYYMEEK